MLRPSTGLWLGESPQGAIRLGLEPALGPEAYRLEVTSDGIRIDGGDPSGVF